MQALHVGSSEGVLSPFWNHDRMLEAKKNRMQDRPSVTASGKAVFQPLKFIPAKLLL
jgi:hypothetical protein